MKYILLFLLISVCFVCHIYAKFRINNEMIVYTDSNGVQLTLDEDTLHNLMNVLKPRYVEDNGTTICEIKWGYDASVPAYFDRYHNCTYQLSLELASGADFIGGTFEFVDASTVPSGMTLTSDGVQIRTGRESC